MSRPSDERDHLIAAILQAWGDTIDMAAILMRIAMTRLENDEQRAQLGRVAARVTEVRENFERIRASRVAVTAVAPN